MQGWMVWAATLSPTPERRLFLAAGSIYDVGARIGAISLRPGWASRSRFLGVCTPSQKTANRRFKRSPGAQICQIRRRWAPGTRFQRPFEIPVFTHAVHATWSGAPAATRPAGPWGAAGTDAPYNAEHGPPLPHIPESKARPAKSWPTRARHVLSHPPPIK